MVLYASYCRAYPDEKGIETINNFESPYTYVAHCRAYPDEKGIETLYIPRPKYSG